MRLSRPQVAPFSCMLSPLSYFLCSEIVLYVYIRTVTSIKSTPHSQGEKIPKIRCKACSVRFLVVKNCWIPQCWGIGHQRRVWVSTAKDPSIMEGRQSADLKVTPIPALHITTFSFCSLSKIPLATANQSHTLFSHWHFSGLRECC